MLDYTAMLQIIEFQHQFEQTKLIAISLRAMPGLDGSPRRRNKNASRLAASAKFLLWPALVYQQWGLAALFRSQMSYWPADSAGAVITVEGLGYLMSTPNQYHEQALITNAPNAQLLTPYCLDAATLPV